MNRKTRLPKGAGSKKRDRLTRESNDSRKEAAKMLQSVSSERLSRYVGAPQLGVVHEEAKKELQKRRESLEHWKRGKPVAGAQPKEPLIRRVAGAARKGVQLIGKGLQEYAKLLSGEKARELEESIETAGMKPEDKAAYIKAKRESEAKALAEEEKELKPYFPMAYPEEEEPAVEKPVPVVVPVPERKPVREEVEPVEETAQEMIADGMRELAEDRAELAEDRAELEGDRAEFASGDFAEEIANDRRELAQDADELQEDRADMERERDEALREVHSVRSRRK